jgi:hypothetical protein
MLTNNNLQIRRDGTRIATLVAVNLMGFLGAAGLQAQSFTLANPVLVDIEKNGPGTSLLKTGQVIVLGFQANGASGYLQVGEYFPDEGKTVNGKAIDCTAAMVKTRFSWVISPNATYLTGGDQVNLTFLPIQQDSSCHNVHSPYEQVVISLQYGQYFDDPTPANVYANNTENRYYMNPPAAPFQQNPVNSLTVEKGPYVHGPISFSIFFNGDISPIAVTYGYTQATTATPAQQITTWASKQIGFGAAVAGTFEIYPDWQAGWTMYSEAFAYTGNRVVPVYMAFQNSAPSTLYMTYYNPVTAQWTGWLAYN